MKHVHSTIRHYYVRRVTLCKMCMNGKEGNLSGKFSKSVFRPPRFWSQKWFWSKKNWYPEAYLTSSFVSLNWSYEPSFKVLPPSSRESDFPVLFPFPSPTFSAFVSLSVLLYVPTSPFTSREWINLLVPMFPRFFSAGSKYVFLRCPFRYASPHLSLCSTVYPVG